MILTFPSHACSRYTLPVQLSFAIPTDQPTRPPFFCTERLLGQLLAHNASDGQERRGGPCNRRLNAAGPSDFRKVQIQLTFLHSTFFSSQLHPFNTFVVISRATFNIGSANKSVYEPSDIQYIPAWQRKWIISTPAGEATLLHCTGS